jgi:hypothetical protein
MSNPTSNFNWQMPTATDLVTDLPADFEVFGQAVDSSLADLKGGTSGQVLSKNSNTDMDFVWVTSDDANAIQNTIVDAKGDLIGATAADTPARLAVGTNGQVLTADSTAATGLAWATPASPTDTFYAGKNRIINGAFYFNQRNFSSTTTANTYGFDRWSFYYEGGTVTYSAQNFTPGTAPVAGYEGKSFMRLATTGQSASGNSTRAYQKIEDVRTFAGQTVTVSFWAKASAGTPFVGVNFIQDFGTGGSPSGAAEGLGSAVTISTSWARYSVTRSVASISGKTIGTTTPGSLNLGLWTSAGSAFASALPGFSALQNVDIDIWGVQVEAGSTATDFQTASGSIGGELALCQRYFQIFGGNDVFEYFGIGAALSTTDSNCVISWFVPMRTAPTATFTTASNYRITQGVSSNTCTVVVGDILTKNNAAIQFKVASGLTAGNANRMLANNTLSATISISAEL